MSSIRKEDALAYHAMGRKGKIEVIPTKPVLTVRDLALAYSPGVAYPCLEIAADVSKVYEYTARGNLVAVISNGTAVLGLGDIGPEASKPVMEGKAILFKKYADIDSVDIELNVTDVDEFVRVVQAMEPTFGGINLEDIKAPECFAIEQRLKESLRIPIMHDDQHGTAIISGAGLLNALEVVGKRIQDARMLINGAGASAVACAKMYLALGLRKENLFMMDSKGLLSLDRPDLTAEKRDLAQASGSFASLDEAFAGMDVFVGLSKANLVTGDMLKRMNDRPIVFALANPDPEITPELAHAARPDVLMATGRSDHPNQVNNVLGFPYIFRGALDVRARTINEEMKMAAARAIAQLAKEPVPDLINQIYGNRLQFGAEYLIPKPMDPRLLTEVSAAVAKAAMDSGVAEAPITDWAAYKEDLLHRQGPEKAFMRSITLKARERPMRLVFPEANSYKVLKAAQILNDDKVAQVILLGNPDHIQRRLQEYEIELPGVQMIDPEAKPELLDQFARQYHESRLRNGITLTEARRQVWQRNYFGMMLVRNGMADTMVTGLNRNYKEYAKPILDVIGLAPGTNSACGLYILRSPKDLYFFADTTLHRNPKVEHLVDIALLTAAKIRQLGVVPRIAFLGYSNFGSNPDDSSRKMAEAARHLRERHPDLIVDGEMQANFALRADLLQEFYPFSPLAKTGANTFIFPSLEAGNIAYKLLQEIGQLESAGPLLLGLAHSVHVMQMGASVREIVNLATLAVLDAQMRGATVT